MSPNAWKLISFTRKLRGVVEFLSPIPIKLMAVWLDLPLNVTKDATQELVYLVILEWSKDETNAFGIQDWSKAMEFVFA
jgi:hypothetical protein